MKPNPTQTAVTLLAIATLTISLHALSAEKKNDTSIKTVPIANYTAQDGVRDSLRYALCKVTNKNLNFWQREYPVDAGFRDRADFLKIQVLPERPKLICKLWPREKAAPLVFILPGLGGHYHSGGPNALAQTFFNAGYSVALICSSMNWEFYLAASRSKAPGLPSTDAIDVREAIRKTIAHIKKNYPGKVSSVYLAGFSLGALHTILIAELEAKSKNKPTFDGYLAVHHPIDAFKAMKKLDELMAARKQWPADKTLINLEKGVAAYLALMTRGLSADGKPDVSKDQASVIIALAYRMSLRELLVAVKKSQNDMGLIKAEYGFTKNDLYKEVNAISFNQYAETFVVNAAAERLGKRFSISTLGEISNLKRMDEFLASSKAKNVRMVTAADDFLLTPGDLEWIAKTFGKRAVIFEHGGHMGELYTPEAKNALVESLKATGQP